MKKKYFIYAVLSAMAFVIFGAIYTTVKAAENSNPMNDLVKAIAQKFNLNVGDVQAVFDEQKTEMETKFQQEFADRLAKAVSDGKLTQAQADLLTAKCTEILAQKEAQKTNIEKMTQEERRESQEAMKTQAESLKQWAKDNNIPQEYLMFLGFGVGRDRGGSGFNGRRPVDDDSISK
jgi:hypothetical protein